MYSFSFFFVCFWLFFWNISENFENTIFLCLHIFRRKCGRLFKKSMSCCSKYVLCCMNAGVFVMKLIVFCWFSAFSPHFQWIHWRVLFLPPLLQAECNKFGLVFFCVWFLPRFLLLNFCCHGNWLAPSEHADLLGSTGPMKVEEIGTAPTLHLIGAAAAVSPVGLLNFSVIPAEAREKWRQWAERWVPTPLIPTEWQALPRIDLWVRTFAPGVLQILRVWWCKFCTSDGDHHNTQVLKHPFGNWTEKNKQIKNYRGKIPWYGKTSFGESDLVVQFLLIFYVI